MHIPGQRMKRTRLAQTEKYVIAVEVEMVYPVDDPSRAITRQVTRFQPPLMSERFNRSGACRRNREPFDEEAAGVGRSLAKGAYLSIRGRVEPVLARLQRRKNDDRRSRGRAFHAFQGNNLRSEGDDLAAEWRERGCELLVVGCKAGWVMDLDQGDEIGWGCIWGHPMGDPFLASCLLATWLLSPSPGLSRRERDYARLCASAL